MGAYSSAVGHDRCHLWVLGELFEHISPNTVLFPACVALEDAVPLAIAVWQFTPLSAGAQYPVDCFNETATFLLLPCVGTRVSLQKCVQFLPLMVGNSLCRHPTIVAIVTERIKRQRTLIKGFFTKPFALPVWLWNVFVIGLYLSVVVLVLQVAAIVVIGGLSLFLN